MVLILTVIISLLLPSSDDLFDSYRKEVDKHIYKVFKIHKPKYVEMASETGCLKKIMDRERLIGYVLLSEVASCNLGGCQIPDIEKFKISPGNNREFFDLMILFNSQKEIMQVDVLNYFSDYGYEITSRNYLRRFKGTKPCDFADSKDEIDTISGATISSMALEYTISRLCGL